jgi:hypothetical protein
VTAIDPLVAAFGEYAANKWDSDNWRDFGRGTGAGDILSSHPRLYRSLGFGDPDYPDAAREVIPQVLKESTGPSQGERMALVAEFAPDLVEWLSGNGTYRTKKRFSAHLAQNSSDIPEEWSDAASQLSIGSGASSSASPQRPATSAVLRQLLAPGPRVTIENKEPRKEEIAVPDPSSLRRRSSSFTGATPMQ